MQMRAFFFLCVLVRLTTAFASSAPIVFVPLDDRPVTRQLPALLGRIAGVPIEMPPRELLGHYLQPGKPDAIILWLGSEIARRPSAYALSSDMLAYGGLVASRVPGVQFADADNRIREIAYLRSRSAHASIGVFGTIMRLAPTGVPAGVSTPPFFAEYPLWTYLQQYANLHDPPLPQEVPVASHLRELIGEPALQGYLSARARNLAIDERLLQLTASGAIDRLVLGQDDAGPVGLHIKDVYALQTLAQSLGLGARVSIEPGADELGMAMIARALARGARWTPHVRVRYSIPNGAQFNDPLEFAPVASAIDGLIALCGGVHDDLAPDLTLYVRIPKSGAPADAALLAAMQTDLAAGHAVALADISFLGGGFTEQAGFVQLILKAGIASRLDAYASWNTNANTVGTALAEAIAAGVGRRTHQYNALAHAEFTYNRYVDDYLFHDVVRPDLNRFLDLQGVHDHTYLVESAASAAQQRNTALLWNQGAQLLAQLYPQYHLAAITITLPWNRTFETEIDAALAPELP